LKVRFLPRSPNFQHQIPAAADVASFLKRNTETLRKVEKPF
jgi:hypothetical protein